MEPLSKIIIRQIHSFLMNGTVNERCGQVHAGEHRTVTSCGWDRELLPAGQINSSLMQLLSNYESQTETDLYEILNFYMKFEQNKIMLCQGRRLLFQI